MRQRCPAGMNYGGRRCGPLLGIRGINSGCGRAGVPVAQVRRTRQIIAMHIGNRGAEGAKGLWENIPLVYRQKATFYTDHWEAYKKVVPVHKHRTAERSDTNHVERFFCTLRQICSWLVRKTLSFSKKEERHLMAIRFFIAHYNLALRL